MSINKQVHIIAGGTSIEVRPHLALSAPAFGQVGHDLKALCQELMPRMDTYLHLTRMAGGSNDLQTPADVERLLGVLKGDPRTKVIIVAAAIVDFRGTVDAPKGRLHTADGEHLMHLTPVPKVIQSVRQQANVAGDVRKDIFLVGFKATSGASGQEQYLAALGLVKSASANLVFANDLENHRCMVVTPEEASYHESSDRMETLRGLVEMIERRSHLTFTRSTVVAGEPVPWSSPLVPGSLRRVIDHCINGGAYKPFHGATVGHFAVKLNENEFLTSCRKTDFNRLNEIGLVRIETDGPDNVVAYGRKPSVGGQSQRIIFREHEGLDCIAHFHCMIREGSAVPVVSQREFECGSHECGQNTSRGLGEFGQIKAVYLDQHGPNIVFPQNIDPQLVIDFIEKNFDLAKKTGGYQLEAV